MSVIRTLATVVEWIAAALLAIFAVIRTLDPNSIQGQIWKDIVGEIHDRQVEIVLVLAFGTLTSKIAQAAMDRWATDRRAIKAVLDAAHKSVFADVAPEEHYAHRVTLFRITRRFRDLPFAPWKWLDSRLRSWPYSLRMYARSGTSYQSASAGLFVNDEDEDANEGVAGKAWFTNASWTVTELPEWPNNCTGNPEHSEERRNYAKKGFMTPEKAHTIRVKSRSLSAHVVRKPTGVRWGVLMFDSRDPKGFGEPAEKKPIMELCAYLLSQLV